MHQPRSIRLSWMQQVIQRQAGGHSTAYRLDLAHHGRDGFARRVGVDVVPAGSPFAVALDVPPEKVQPLVDMGDQRLFRRQAQAHRGQDLGDLLRSASASSLLPAPSGTSHPRTGRAGSWAGLGGGAWRAPLVAAGPPGPAAMCSSRTDSATLLSNGERIQPCGVPAGCPEAGILAEDARLQERLHQGQDALVPDASPHPVHQGGMRDLVEAGLDVALHDPLVSLGRENRTSATAS